MVKKRKAYIMSQFQMAGKNLYIFLKVISLFRNNYTSWN